MSTQPLELVAESEQLSTVIKVNSLAPETAQSLQASFLPLFTEARGILERSRAITVTDASQKLEMRLAGECRKALKAVRINADKLRKSLKEEYLRGGRAVDGFNAILLHLIDSEETRLEAQEKFVEQQEAQRKAQIKAKREEQLSAFGVDTKFYSLSEMDEAAYQQLLSNTIAAEEKRRDDTRKAEIARIEKEKADAEERERIRLDNERLRKEAVEREEAARIEREKAEAARKEAEAKAAAERVAWEAKRKAEQDAAFAAAEIERKRVEAERVAAEEVARKERLRLQALADVERQKAAASHKETEEKLTAERQAREKAEFDLKVQKEAADRKAKADALAAKKAAAAPDKTKLLALAQALEAVPMPPLSTPEAAQIVGGANDRRVALCIWLKTEAEKL